METFRNIFLFVAVSFLATPLGNDGALLVIGIIVTIVTAKLTVTAKRREDRVKEKADTIKSETAQIHEDIKNIQATNSAQDVAIKVLQTQMEFLLNGKKDNNKWSTEKQGLEEN